jgi:hypothetical protein
MMSHEPEAAEGSAVPAGVPAPPQPQHL